MVLRYLLDDPTVEIEAVDKSLRGTLSFGASQRVQRSIVDQLYFIRKTMLTLDKDPSLRSKHSFTANGNGNGNGNGNNNNNNIGDDSDSDDDSIDMSILGGAAVDNASDNESEGESKVQHVDARDQEIQKVLKERLRKISQVIDIAESTSTE